MKHLLRKFPIIITIFSLLSVFSGCSLTEKGSSELVQTNPPTATEDKSKESSIPNQEPTIVNDSKETSQPNLKSVKFSTFDVNKKYYNDAKGFVELKLKLPQLDGNFEGISKINKYFIDKEKFYYDELPLDILKEYNEKVEGEKDNWYRSADYSLEIVSGDIISMKAYLDGGAGGVSWAGIAAETFNLNTGNKLELNDIFNVNEAQYMNFIYDLVSKKIMDEIKSDNESRAGYMFDDAYSGEGYKSIRNFDKNDFYLSENALVVFYQKYALADGASGPLVFEIPYDSISNILAIETLKK